MRRRYHLQSGYRPASFIVIEIVDGLEGIGETYAGVYAPEAVAALVAQLARELEGQDATNISAA
jgi:L-alanine-DL-glutamate epimerase-like enolase superfamily enzyme